MLQYFIFVSSRRAHRAGPIRPTQQNTVAHMKNVFSSAWLRHARRRFVWVLFAEEIANGVIGRGLRDQSAVFVFQLGHQFEIITPVSL